MKPKRQRFKTVGARVNSQERDQYHRFAQDLGLSPSKLVRILLDLAMQEQKVRELVQEKARELRGIKQSNDLDEQLTEEDDKPPPHTVEAFNSVGYFKPESVEDARKLVKKAIVQRQGQPRFRKQLLDAYQGKCAVTGCDVREALEAAHIHPYKGVLTNQVGNGLLLRADIHTLFDLYLITVEPGTKQIRIAPELRDTTYKELEGKHLELPQDPTLHPRVDLLQWHYIESLTRYPG